MQGLYQLSRLKKNKATPLPAIPDQRFYRLWVVEDHIAWTAGRPEQPLDLAETLWFFPKYFKPGIPYYEVEGFTFWFDDHFLSNNPLLETEQYSGPWTVRQPFVLSATDSFSVICNLCRDHLAYLSQRMNRKNTIAYLIATLLLLHLKEAAVGKLLPEGSSKKFPLMDDFMELVNRHYQEQHQPYFYADILHVTVDTLRRQCKDAFAQTPTELIQQKLLEEAKDLLLMSDRSIKQIAHTLGFEDESYFVRFFRQQCLMPPRAYRRSFVPYV